MLKLIQINHLVLAIRLLFYNKLHLIILVDQNLTKKKQQQRNKMTTLQFFCCNKKSSYVYGNTESETHNFARLDIHRIWPQERGLGEGGGGGEGEGEGRLSCPELILTFLTL